MDGKLIHLDGFNLLEILCVGLGGGQDGREARPLGRSQLAADTLCWVRLWTGRTGSSSTWTVSTSPAPGPSTILLLGDRD